MMAEESKNSDTTRFDMRPVTPDRAGSSGLGILLVFMLLAVPALIAITFLMQKPSEVADEHVPESTEGFFKDLPIKMPLGLVAPEEHPGVKFEEMNEPAPEGTPEELLQVETIQRRAMRPRPLIPMQEPEPEWKREIHEQLQKRISFDFVDTPLADVVAFLRSLTNTNMVLDPAVVDGDDVPVTMKVSDMKLSAALKWILRLVNLSYELTDEAIFISTPERLDEMVPARRDMKIVYRVYDLRGHVKEDGLEVLLNVIRHSIAADWQAPEAMLTVVDGRLMIRHRRIIVRMVEEMMDEFVRASSPCPEVQDH